MGVARKGTRNSMQQRVENWLERRNRSVDLVQPLNFNSYQRMHATSGLGGSASIVDDKVASIFNSDIIMRVDAHGRGGSAGGSSQEDHSVNNDGN